MKRIAWISALSILAAIHSFTSGAHVLTEKTKVLTSLEPNVEIAESDFDYDENLDTRLYDAITRGDLKAVKKRAWTPGVNLNAVNAAGNSYLHLAVFKGQEHIVKYLTEWTKNPTNNKRVNIDLRNNKGYTSLGIAIKRQNASIVEYFMQNHTRHIDKYRNVDYRNVNAKGDSAIGMTIRELSSKVPVGNLEPNTERWIKELLDVASNHGKKGVNSINLYGDYPLHLAVLSNKKILIDYILDCDNVNKSVTNRNKNTALHLAVMNGNAEAVGQLVFAGAKVNKRNEDGNTSLHLAASLKENTNEVIKALAESVELELEIVNNAQKTPLQVANDCGNEIAKSCIGELISERKKNEENIKRIIGEVPEKAAVTNNGNTGAMYDMTNENGGDIHGLEEINDAIYGDEWNSADGSDSAEEYHYNE